MGDLAGARQTMQECLAIAREMEDQYMTASALGSLGGIAMTLGEYEEAERCAPSHSTTRAVNGR